MIISIFVKKCLTVRHVYVILLLSKGTERINRKVGNEYEKKNSIYGYSKKKRCI